MEKEQIRDKSQKQPKTNEKTELQRQKVVKYYNDLYQNIYYYPERVNVAKLAKKLNISKMTDIKVVKQRFINIDELSKYIYVIRQLQILKEDSEEYLEIKAYYTEMYNKQNTMLLMDTFGSPNNSDDMNDGY